MRGLLRAVRSTLGVASRPPVPPVRVHAHERVATAHGHEWADDFAGLADRQHPAVLRYLREEASHARAVLGRVDPGFQRALQAEIESRELYASVSIPTVYRGYAYYRRVDPTTREMVDCRAPLHHDGGVGVGGGGGTGPEQVILDHALLSRDIGGYANISRLKISPDSRWMAFTVDRTGGERYEAHLVDLSAPGQQPVEVVEDVCSVEWSRDGSTLLFTRADDLLRPSQLLSHRVGSGSGPAGDTLLFEEADARYFLDVSTTKDGEWFTINCNSKLESEVWLMPTALADVPADPVLVHPRSSTYPDSSVGGGGGGEGCTYFVEHRCDRFYIVTNADGAANFKVVSAPETDPTRSSWQDFVATDDARPIEDAEMFASHCVVHRRDAWGLPELLVVPYEDPDGSVVVRSDELHLGHAQQPGSGGGSGGGGGGGRQSNPDNSPDAFSLHPHPNSDFEANFFSFSTTTPLAPFTDWCFDLETAKLTVTAQQDAVGAPHFAAQHYRAYRRLVPPPDDDDMQQQHPPQPQQQHPPQPPAVPVTLVHREGIPLDGTAPLLMLAYGAYGTVLEPDFKAEHLALLRRGWVIAYCHARGGGELGPRWHQAGARLEKLNTMADLERCCDWLVAEGFTRPGRIVGKGVSAGAVPFASLCNRRPGLFGGLVLKVPFLGVLAAMLDPGQPLTLHERDEWGDPIACEAAFDAIRAYCPTHNIRTNHQRYPPIFATASMDDERVPYWHPAKFVAGLRQQRVGDGAEAVAMDQDQLFLLTEEDGGHFGGGQEHQLHELAFMFRALRLPFR